VKGWRSKSSPACRPLDRLEPLAAHFGVQVIGIDPSLKMVD
jgi:hypothetical protein